MSNTQRIEMNFNPNERSFINKTDMISIYRPYNSNLRDLKSLVNNELKTAKNIKDRQTRQSVSSALNSCL